MPEILLTTLNAKYLHASFGLRYLMANMGELQDRTGIAEYDINQRPVDILESILAQNPRIVGIGVYIWNIDPVTRLVSDLKRIRPDITVVLGGPEVSYETEKVEVTRIADYTITGEADFAFAKLCSGLLSGTRPLMRVIAADLPHFDALKLPYDLYTDRDIAHRIIYVEASRGCPFTCEFCLSSLDIPVRAAVLEQFLGEMQKLLDRGVKHFKFVDRTFNLNLKVGKAILQFFLDRMREGLFLHFEMIPDRLPEQLRGLIKQFPAGVLQFEIGIQSFNDETCELISRRQDHDKLEDNIRFLRGETGVHIHADLIVGLPGEDIESFGRGFDRLVKMGPQEIQVGILKRLRGTPIVRHDEAWKMVYSPAAPYEILQNKLIGFGDMQRMRRFARYWDLVGNSGNFTEGVTAVFGEGSAFEGFMAFCDWLHAKVGQTHGIALHRLAELIVEFLETERGMSRAEAVTPVRGDYFRLGRELPEFLRVEGDYELVRAHSKRSGTGGHGKRQGRHEERDKE